jgi:hypothetical protein
MHKLQCQYFGSCHVYSSRDTVILNSWFQVWDTTVSVLQCSNNGLQAQQCWLGCYIGLLNRSRPFKRVLKGSWWCNGACGFNGNCFSIVLSLQSFMPTIMTVTDRKYLSCVQSMVLWGFTYLQDCSVLPTFSGWLDLIQVDAEVTERECQLYRLVLAREEGTYRALSQ